MYKKLPYYFVALLVLLALVLSTIGCGELPTAPSCTPAAGAIGHCRPSDAPIVGVAVPRS